MICDGGEKSNGNFQTEKKYRLLNFYDKSSTCFTKFDTRMNCINKSTLSAYFKSLFYFRKRF